MSNPVAATTHADGSRDYPYAPTGESFPSITTIIEGTRGKPWLPPWASRLTAEYSIDNLEELAALKALQGRDAAVDLAKREGERIRNRKRDTGGYVHDVVEALVLWQASPEGRGGDLVLPELPAHLRGEYYDDMPIEYVAEWMVEGFLNFCADFNPEFRAAEMTVYNPLLKVAGTLDMIVRLPGLAVGRAGRLIPGGGVVSCIDVKTGRQQEETWPEQVAGYRRMTVARMPLGDLVSMPGTDCGAVLHLRPEHERGYQLMLISPADDAAAWNRFRRAAGIFAGRKSARKKPGKVCRPLRADGTIPQPRLADLDGEGYGRALAPLRKAGIENLEQVAAMTPAHCRQVKGVGPKVLELVRAMLGDHGLALAGETFPAEERSAA